MYCIYASVIAAVHTETLTCHEVAHEIGGKSKEILGIWFDGGPEPLDAIPHAYDPLHDRNHASSGDGTSVGADGGMYVCMYEWLNGWVKRCIYVRVYECKSTNEFNMYVYIEAKPINTRLTHTYIYTKPTYPLTHQQTYLKPASRIKQMHRILMTCRYRFGHQLSSSQNQFVSSFSTCRYVCMFVCSYVCMHVYTNVCTNVCMPVYEHEYAPWSIQRKPIGIRTCTCTCIRKCILKCILKCVCVWTVPGIARSLDFGSCRRWGWTWGHCLPPHR